MHKIAVTGHTSGIGNLIYSNYNCRGFSRSNGYDLSSSDTIDRMLLEVEECNIFINNAFPYIDETNYKHMHIQTQLLYEIYNNWKYENKLIINIGSNTTDGIKKDVWPYSAAKESLEKASEQLTYHSGNCYVSLLKLGFVETDRIVKNFPKEPKLPLTSLTKSINFIIDNWQSNVKVKELSLIP